MSNTTTPSPAATATPATTATNLAKFVNIIEANVKDTINEADCDSNNASDFSSGTYVPRAPQVNEIIFDEPTFMERFARYFVVLIYLCGLCSLGFFLSIYHIFIWDSRMPPVFKGQKKPTFG